MLAPSTTRASCRPANVCWNRMLRSPVTKTSKPARSAAVSSAPLASRDQPFSRVVETSCPGSRPRTPSGTLWSSSIRRTRPRRLPGVAPGVVQDLADLIFGHAELLHDLGGRHAVVVVVDDGLRGEARALQDRGAGDLARHHLDQRAAGPVYDLVHCWHSASLPCGFGGWRCRRCMLVL